MAEVKQILVVDDHFEMLEFFRSMLEMSSQDYQVIGVPSAEEGFLELRRTPFDLLITDVRLPGMSGFELVRRVQRLRPEIPIIMITAYSSNQGKEEAAELGIFRYFQKPLNTDSLLAAVHSALYGEVELGLPAAAAYGRGKPLFEIGAEVRERLRTLRTDTGATRVVLADSQGQVMAQLGEEHGADMTRLASITAAAMENGFRLAEELQSNEPLMIQYQAGASSELYTANVGSSFFVMLLFAVRERRGRIGTIWVFAQRAIRELKEMLPAPVQTETLPAPDPVIKDIPVKKSPARQPRRSESSPKAEREEREAAVASAPPGKESRIREEATPDVPVSLEEMMADGELAELFGEVQFDEEHDLDAFWDSALGTRGENDEGEGFSFDEAMRRGLIPPELGPEGEEPED